MVSVIAPPSHLLDSQVARERLRETLRSEGIAYSPGFLSSSEVGALVRKLESIKSSSAPEWKPLSYGVENFYWINDNFPGSTVKGAFSQINFFPWNSASREMFDTMGDVLRVRNLLLGQEEDAFFDPARGDDVTVRLAAQFYPSGKGWMQEHRDPEGPHQTVLASLVLSRFGVDYRSGGLFVRGQDGSKVFPEKDLFPGDLLWFAPTVHHGVDEIVPVGRDDGFLGWDSCEGRWMLLFATNAISPHVTYAGAEALD